MMIQYSGASHSAFQTRIQTQTTPTTSTTTLMMVRNIDLPEAVILYGSDVVSTTSSSSSSSTTTTTTTTTTNDDGIMINTVSLRPGLEALLRECQADQVAVMALLQPTCEWLLLSSSSSSLSPLQQYDVICRPQTVEPPNPHDLLQAIASVEVQPKPFGGSAGFGQRQFLDPPRPPLPARTVVLTHTSDQTRASRLAGMRVVRFLLEDGGNEDENADDDDLLADYVVDNNDEIDFGIDDISTPGSFWLNPPHPRDDQGNKVDPYELARVMTEQHQNPVTNKSIDLPETTTTTTTSTEEEQDLSTATTSDIDDEELRRMLADIDPL